MKLNNVGKPEPSNGYKFVKNDDNSITASTAGLEYKGGSIFIHILRTSVQANHYYFFSINILSMVEKLGNNDDSILDFTHHVYRNNVESWPRVKNISSLNDTGVHTGTFLTISTKDSLYIESYDWVEFTFKDTMVIDLTLMFGEGNEPSQNWCDKYLTNYYEYNEEGTLIPIKQLGELIKTSYYDKIDMFDY